MDYPNKRIRIKDIAEQAGVSTGTVDRVLHNREGVSAASRKKVEKILKEINFRPNYHASVLANKRMFNFICLIPEHAEWEYWSEVELGINRAWDDFRDFNVSVSIKYYDQFDPVSYKKALAEISGEAPDGWIIAPAYEEETIEWVKNYKISAPYVFIDSQVQSLNPLSFFCAQSFVSGRLAASLLFPDNVVQSPVVMFQTLKPGHLPGQQVSLRIKGFESYMREYFPEVQLHTLILDPLSVQAGYDQVSGFLDSHKDIKTGVIFNSRAYLITSILSGRQHKFNLLGYDLLPRNVEALKQGHIKFILSQRPQTQGYLGVKSLVEHFLFKKYTGPGHYMPIDILQYDNISFFMDYEREISGL